jgi:hypothetical protein
MPFPKSSEKTVEVGAGAMYIELHQHSSIELAQIFFI